jgi:feruloyl esterase
VTVSPLRVLVLATELLVAHASAAADDACDLSRLSALALQHANVVEAKPFAGGAYVPPGTADSFDTLPAFCLVAGEATPTADSRIRFELWMPRAAWNGKLVVTGNSGYSPALSYRDMAYALRQGYAVAGGDTGHQAADPNDLKWGVAHREKIVDWGTRSIHAITGPVKAIVAHLAGKAASRAYFYGCSTGGHQAYAEVQRYPEDFDGLVAGAPGNNRVALNTEFLWRYRANRAHGRDSGQVILTREKAQVLNAAAVAACDALDGVKDGVIDDPRACTGERFDIERLACADGDAPNCLTPAQIAAAKKIYGGPRNPRTGAQIYPGPVVGTEAGWPLYWGEHAPARVEYWRHWVYNNPWWNWWDFDFDRDVDIAIANTASMIDHNSADLSAFESRGGRLIVFQGWADPVVNPTDTIAYYEKVRAARKSSGDRPGNETDRFMRLFMVPGLDHCRGGPGVNVFGNGGQAAPLPGADNDLLQALDRWVTEGKAPERIVAARIEAGKVVRTRPLCVYPQRAVYTGTGSTDDAANFACRR